MIQDGITLPDTRARCVGRGVDQLGPDTATVLTRPAAADPEFALLVLAAAAESTDAPCLTTSTTLRPPNSSSTRPRPPHKR
jgi:hypothetical protein